MSLKMHAKHGSVNIPRAHTTTCTTKRVTPYYSHQQCQKADEEPDHYAVTPVTIRTSVLTRNIVPNSKAPNNMRTLRVLPFKNPYTNTSNKTSGQKGSRSQNRFENPYIIKKKTGNVDGGSELSDLQMQIRKVRLQLQEAERAKHRAEEERRVLQKELSLTRSDLGDYKQQLNDMEKMFWRYNK